jgi:hypothetical protein
MQAFSEHINESAFMDSDSDALKVSLALRNVIFSTAICSNIIDGESEVEWRVQLLKAIQEVVIGFRKERPLLDGKKIDMRQWMELRTVTISGWLFLLAVSRAIPLTCCQFVHF